MVYSISSSPPFRSTSSLASDRRSYLSLFLLKSSTVAIISNSEINYEKTSLQIEVVNKSNSNLFPFTLALCLTPLLRQMQYLSFVSVNYLKLIGEDKQFLLLCSILLYAYRIVCKIICIFIFYYAIYCVTILF